MANSLTRFEGKSVDWIEEQLQGSLNPAERKILHRELEAIATLDAAPRHNSQTIDGPIELIALGEMFLSRFPTTLQCPVRFEDFDRYIHQLAPKYKAIYRTAPFQFSFNIDFTETRWAQASPEVKQRIEDSMRGSVEMALTYASAFFPEDPKIPNLFQENRLPVKVREPKVTITFGSFSFIDKILKQELGHGLPALQDHDAWTMHVVHETPAGERTMMSPIIYVDLEKMLEEEEFTFPRILAAVVHEIVGHLPQIMQDDQVLSEKDAFTRSVAVLEKGLQEMEKSTNQMPPNQAAYFKNLLPRLKAVLVTEKEYLKFHQAAAGQAQAKCSAE